jgi:uncharacterized repeat protein (TIGR01451 family)
MKSKSVLSLFILVLLAGSLLPAGLVQATTPTAGPPWYVRGDFNAWGTDLMYDDGTHGDDATGDGIYTVVITVTTAGRYEFKVDDGNWTESYPPSNAWIETAAADTPVKFTFDTNTYSDGWVPTHNIVNAEDGLTTWTAVGDWQGWDNGNPATAMASLGGGLYDYVGVVATAGAHDYKTCRTGTWDAIGPDGDYGGRSINTANLGFTTTVNNQVVRFLLNANTGRIQVQLPSTEVLINEFDSQTPGTDAAEFIELYDGGAGNASLDGLVLVFFNGNATNDASYYAMDLDGYSTDANGYFVAGNTAVPGVDLVFPGNTLQNGQDAIGLFMGDAAQFPNGTPCTNTNLIDAVVYDDFPPGTPDPVLEGILLNPGQVMTFEGPDANNTSAGRCPNGTGGMRNTDTYTPTVPSPDAPNECPAPPTPDVAVAKTGPDYVGGGGGDMDYILTYEMTGGADGFGIVLTDTLPAGVTYVSFDSILPVTLTNSDPVVFDAGSLAGLGSNVITLTANVPAGLPFGTLLTNTVAITCSDDTVSGNNEDSWTTLVVGSEISLGKAGPAFVLMGEPIAYTLTYTVEGDPAEGVIITDTLPADVTYVSDNAPVVPTEPTPGTWVWSMGTVTDSGSFVVQGLVSSNPLTWTLHNEAWVYATNDTDMDNNDAFADTMLPLPIYEIQHVDTISGTSPSPYLGQDVVVMGVVVAGSWVYPSGAGNPVRYFLADPDNYGPWQGLFVYDPIHVVTEGQLLVLGGNVAEYSGMTELDVGSGDYFQVLDENWPVPAPILTTTEAITTPNPLMAEPLESVLVEVNCAEVTRLPNNYGEWLITDGSGVAAQVDDLGDYAYVPALGDVLTVRGMLFYSYSHFKLEPRGDADIVPGMSIVATGPADGAMDVPVHAVVTATFSISLNPSTVTTATFYLEGVPGTASYDAGTWTATFTPDADLANNTTYTAHATTGIESESGAVLCEEYTWSFTTEELPGPDLRESSKLADRSEVQAGDTLTYTIRLLNTGELTASAMVTDVVPAEVTVLTATLPPGMVYDNGQLLWSGEVYPDPTPLLLSFQAQVGAGVPAGTTIRNVVWIDDGVHLFTRTVSVQVVGMADIVVTPLAFTVTLAPDQTANRNLTIENVGEAELFWLLSEVIPVDWLSEAPDFGQVPAGEQDTAVITFDAAGLTVGTYTTTLDVNSTDPDEPHIFVDVTLVVTDEVPVWNVYLPVVMRSGGK